MGHEAWLRGELDRAVELLKAELVARPGLLDAILPHARALSERNEPEKALSILAGATTDGGGDAGRLFRAIILYDHGHLEAAAETLSSLTGKNLIAKSLEALLAFRGSAAASGSIALPPGARWISEVAGRLLALVEDRLHRSDAAAVVTLHHPFFSPRAVACNSPIEEAFAAQRYAEVEQIHRQDMKHDERPGGALAWLKGVPRYFRGATATPREIQDSFLAFSLLGLGRDQDAVRLLAKARLENPSNADFHFIEGLCHVRLGRVREAGWSFVRASRLADTEVDPILLEVASKAGIRIVTGDVPGD